MVGRKRISTHPPKFLATVLPSSLFAFYQVSYIKTRKRRIRDNKKTRLNKQSGDGSILFGFVTLVGRGQHEQDFENSESDISVCPGGLRRDWEPWPGEQFFASVTYRNKII